MLVPNYMPIYVVAAEAIVISPRMGALPVWNCTPMLRKDRQAT